MEPFLEWPQLFAGDKRLAEALIDRNTYRFHILQVTGDNYRRPERLGEAQTASGHASEDGGGKARRSQKHR